MPSNHPAKILVDKWVPKNRIKSQSILHHTFKLGEKTILPDNRKPLSKTLKVPPNKHPAPPDINSKLFGNENLTKSSDPLTLKTAAEKTILNYPENWTHVYTDGSAEEATKNAGWGVWIQRPNGITEELYDACGADCSNYDAEVCALRKAIDHLQKQFDENPPTATSAVILTDSLSALEGLESGDLDENLLQITHKAEKLRLTHLVELKLQWIPGHAGINGNERADRLAKLGSKQPQPITPTTFRTVKQKIKQTYKKKMDEKLV